MILDNILNKIRYKQQVVIPRQDLVMLGLALLKEADSLEQDNTGAPGKAAIEFLLNQKYSLIENHNVSDSIRDAILKEIDSVITKVVAKYHVKRKGKNFYFDEALEIAILSPEKIANPDANQLLANIYAAQVELQTLRIQLTRTNLQDISTVISIKQAILDKELEIKDMKKKLRLFTYFDSVSDQDSLYRRSLGEAKKEVTTGAVAGGLVGANIASGRFKKKVDYVNKQKKFQQTAKNLDQTKKNMTGMAAELKHLHDTGLTPNKEKKANKILKTMKQTLGDQRNLRKGYKKGAKQMLNLSKEAIKKGLKGGLKGAAIGAGLGLGAAAIHKAKNESLSYRLNEHLNRLNEKSQILKTFKDSKGIYQLDTLRNRTKNFLTSPRVNNRFTISAALLVGGVGISLLLKKAKEKGAGATIGSIKRVMSRVQKSDKYTNTQKAKIRNSGNLAIQKINQTYKKK